MMVDHPDEPTRLAELYSEMSDEELQQIAKDSSMLTDVAQRVLGAELTRRHLAMKHPAGLEGGKDAEYRNLVIVRRFRDLPEALLAKVAWNRPASNVTSRMTTWCAWTGLFPIFSEA
jgi:hypothetical protein